MEYYKGAEEFSLPASEYSYPKEHIVLPESEYYGQKEDSFAPEPKKKSKSAALKPLLALISVVSVVFASFGFDFLAGEKEISPEPIPGVEGDLAFPILENLDPDFKGEYAWGGYGSEEYIRVIPFAGSDYVYLVMGGAWEYFGNSLGSLDGARYDRNSNTLTLENCNIEMLDVNLMGNGFTVKLIGDNRIGSIKMWGAYYGGSLTIKGKGTLSVDGDISLEGEFSQTCLMIDANVEVMGSIAISATSMEKAIYYLAPVKMTGGTRSAGAFFTYYKDQYDNSGNYIGSVETDIYGIEGPERYYDYGVVDPSGNLAKHIVFSK